jgi:hypothetical protein
MTQWEYCYANETLEPDGGGGLERSHFIARPDRPETRDDLTENQLLAILGGEGWELVSVVGVQTRYSEGRSSMGGVPLAGAVDGSSNTTSTMYYFKRPAGSAGA